MKRFSFIIISVMMFASFTCVTNSQTPKRIIAPNVPEELRVAINEAPDDVFIGVGAANTVTLSMVNAIRMADTRAMADIARQVNSVSQRMIIHYMDTNDLSADERIIFSETITTRLSRLRIPPDSLVSLGSAIDDDGYLWTAVSVKKDLVADQISHVTNEEILQRPFDARPYFDDVFILSFDEELGARAR